MATYYVAEGGTAANKAAATSGTYPTGCMSPSVHNGETFSAGDTIYLSDEGGDFVGTGTYVFNVPSSGSSGSPITYAAKDGDTPVIDGADDLTTAAHLWTESSTSGEFYVRTSGGGDASIVDPQAIKMGSTYVIVEGYSAGSLNDLEAAFGDNDGLGYNTLYVRDDTNGNPETSGVTILAQQRVPFRVYQKSYITIDGITARHSAPQWYGGFHVDQSGAGSNCIVQNCIAEYNSSGIEMQRGNNNVIDNNIVRYNFGLGINHKGATGVQITGSEIKNNVVHTTYQTRFTSGLEDGYGIKCYWWNGGSVHNNEVYGCEFQGVDLDGDSDNWSGTDSVLFYENYIHDNDGIGLMVEVGSDNNLIYTNWIEDNTSHQIRIWYNSKNNEFFSNVIIDSGTSNYLFQIHSSDQDAWACSGTKLYNNILYGGSIGIYVSGVNGLCVNNMKIYNNIFANQDGNIMYMPSADFTGFDSDYNLFNEYLAIGGRSWATWQGLGYDTNSIDTATSPFTNAASGDFTIPVDSEAIGVADKTLGSPYNIGLLPGASWPDGVTTGDRDDY